MKPKETLCFKGEKWNANENKRWFFKRLDSSNTRTNKQLLWVNFNIEVFSFSIKNTQQQFEHSFDWACLYTMCPWRSARY